MLSAMDLGGRLDFNCPMDPEVLLDAAIRGDVPCLISLRHQNAMLLETFLPNHYSRTPPLTTPLHRASLFGRTAFAAELIRLKPELTRIKDSKGLLPIHLAAARGHTDLVKEMLQYNKELGIITNNEGRNAVHLAAACGRIEVIDEMLKSDVNLAEKVSEVYEEMLHTCVRHGHLDATRSICAKCPHLVCWKDSDGNTALHVAVTKRNALIVNFLLKDTNVDVNAENNDGYTALDLALKSDMGYVDGDFCRMMVCAGARKGRGPMQNATDGEEIERSQVSDEAEEKAWFQDMQNTILIVATVIAGATFQSGIEKASGSPQFRFFNALSMGTSMALILFLASGSRLMHWITTRLLLMLLWVSLASMALAYGTFIFRKEGPGPKVEHSKIATGFLAGISSLLVLVFMSHVVGLVRGISNKKRTLSNVCHTPPIDAEYPYQ